MASIGAEMLIEAHGTCAMDVAIAVVEGRLRPTWSAHLDEVVTPMMLEAAKLQVAQGVRRVIDGTATEVVPDSRRIAR